MNRLRRWVAVAGVVLSICMINTGLASAAYPEPIGAVDLIEQRGNFIHVEGWAFTPGELAAGGYVVVLDHQPRGASGQKVYTTVFRPDVNAALGIAVGNAGFSHDIYLSQEGWHTVCVYALQIGDSQDTRDNVLGCETYHYSEVPFGAVDSVTLDGFTATVEGWAIDQSDVRQPLTVDVVSEGPDGIITTESVTTSILRPDVATFYRLPATTAHGFRATVRVQGGGPHHVCAVGVNIGDGFDDSLLGCREVTTPSPFGRLDQVTNPSVGNLKFLGWSVDPDVPSSTVENHVYVTAPDGKVAGYSGNLGTGSRPDVGAAYPGVGNAHGFSATVPVTMPGRYSVCSFAIGVRSAAVNSLLGCRSVDVRNTFGSLDTAVATGGQVTVSGWALNPNDRPQAVEIHVYDFGPDVTTGHSGIVASRSRPDVDAAFRYGADHGFRYTLPAATPGRHTLCAFGITTGGGSGNTLLGCRDVQIP